ncbi:MAG: type IV secretory system conjugative DNA transfer family protein [Actinomycetota bacterium]|jgi:type IV secretion system protein VirD4|nr:type IV secretory system conjugative DNA transfer family protein [Actinomycetota bacterium]
MSLGHLSVLLAAGAVGAVLASGGLGHRRAAPKAPAARRPPVSGPRRARSLPEGARWARPADLRSLRSSGATRGRLVLGEEVGRVLRHQVLAAEPAQSVAVIGPTQSGKTTSLAIPAILRWEGPVLAASVKTDLVRDTLEWRRRLGTVWCFDPAGTTGLPRSPWSPVSAARTWARARRVASDLTDVARGDGTSADGEFWYATAAKLLAPLLFAAAVDGRTMHDVVRWVDTQETEEVLDILQASGVPDALQAARATWLRDERQRSAVYTTAETVLEPFAEPQSRWEGWPDQHTPPYGVPVGGEIGPEIGGEIDPAELPRGPHTLYMCAPAHDQQRLRAVFCALVSQVVHAAFAAASRTGRPLDPPMLVVLDEAANIAPLKELDGLAATCAGHGVQLVTVWQDLAQVRARYGERAATVVNNHRAKLFLPGIADPGTLDFASHLAGDQLLETPSVTHGARGERTVTTSPQVRRLLPPDTLRRLPKGDAVLLYGALPPVRLRLRSWFTDPDLVARGRSGDRTRLAVPDRTTWRPVPRWLRRWTGRPALQSHP